MNIHSIYERNFIHSMLWQTQDGRKHCNNVIGSCSEDEECKNHADRQQACFVRLVSSDCLRHTAGVGAHSDGVNEKHRRLSSTLSPVCLFVLFVADAS